MQLTPSGAFEHVKESIVEYLETAYKIAHPALFAERGEMLRRRGTVAQAPFIEATPAFPTARKLIGIFALGDPVFNLRARHLDRLGCPRS